MTRSGRTHRERNAALRVCRGVVDAKSARNARSAWGRREGLLLRLEEDCVAGFGEASPLPGYSPDDLATARRQIDAWCARWRAGDLAGVEDATGPVPWVDLDAPSARYAVETALLDLEARRRGLTLYEALGGSPDAPPIPLAALVADMGSAEERFADGIRTFKIKVGADLEAEIGLIDALRARFGDTVALRLDANRSLDSSSLDPSRAGRTMERWAASSPEMIEEPVADVTSLRGAPIGIGLDESLQSADAWLRLEPWLDAGPCVAVVLKPMVLGLRRCFELADLARGRGLGVVVSHTFDGPVALQAAASLALALSSMSSSVWAAGLARHAGLAAWPESAAWQPCLVGKDRIDATAARLPGLGLDAWALWDALRPEGADS